MIKLFWNTQNQIPPTTNNPNNEDVFDHNWGLYHQKNSFEWIKEILKKIKFEIINDENDLTNEDILIIIDSSVEKKIKLYSKLRLLCAKIFLIHLGDEANSYNLSPVYNNCDFVWRTFCSGKYFNNDKVMCLPIGYKSGVALKKGDGKRKYKWAFMGTPHKSSRQDLLFQLSSINPNFSYKTKKFDQDILGVNEMNEILSLTTFIPCPNGFVHPETYRLYEALQCDCIPIVEDSYKYYDRLFPGNPFIKIEKWLDAKLILENWDEKKILDKKKECSDWWKSYKESIQEIFFKKIH